MSSTHETIRVRADESICVVQMHRPEAANAINDRLISELTETLRMCHGRMKVVVLEGMPEVFCNGADFGEIRRRVEENGRPEQNPEPLYDLWHQLATGPFITVAHVRGKANAGGIGFVSACDIVLSDSKAVFSLSELLFGLMPACVMPFLIRRIGFAKANYMTLMTQPVSAMQAVDWGLVDICEENSENLLRKQLLRLRRLDMDAITRYKRYANSLDSSLGAAKAKALQANIEVFSDRKNLQKIARYVSTGKFPWEEN